MTAPYSATQYALDQEITAHAAAGWRLEVRTQTTAVLSSGGEPNHVLHAILSVFTIGLWVPIWLLVIATNNPRRMTLIVDPNGAISRVDNAKPQTPAGPLPGGFWRKPVVIMTLSALGALVIGVALAYLSAGA